MDQPCYKCGQLLEQGRPFCPQCAAPQIRVLPPEPAAVSSFGQTAISQTATPGEEPSGASMAALPGARARALKACLLSVVVALLLRVLGLNFFAAVFGAGLVAVFLYQQWLRGITIATATGAGLGALSGFLCFGITSLLPAAAILIPEGRAKVYQQILENAEKFVAAHPELPQLQDGLTQLKDPQTFIVAMIMAGVVMLVISTILGGLGGALGSLLFRRRNR